MIDVESGPNQIMKNVVATFAQAFKKLADHFFTFDALLEIANLGGVSPNPPAGEANQDSGDNARREIGCGGRSE